MPVPPSNDLFANAADLGSGQSGFVSGSNSGAGVEPNEPPCWVASPNPFNSGKFGTSSFTVWYKWTAPTTGQYFFSTHSPDFETNFASCVQVFFGHGNQNPEILSDVTEVAYLYNQAAGLGMVEYGAMVGF